MRAKVFDECRKIFPDDLYHDGATLSCQPVKLKNLSDHDGRESYALSLDLSIFGVLAILFSLSCI